MKTVLGALFLVGFGIAIAGGDPAAFFRPAVETVGDMTTAGADGIEQNAPEISRGFGAAANAFRTGAAQLGTETPTTTGPVQP